MIKKRLLIVTLILALLGTPIIALASGISEANYYAIIQISNNSTATANVATTANISTTNLIAGNYLNSSANNCVLRTSAGADVPFMPGYTPDGNPWSIWVPSIGDYSYQNDILYTANSTGGLIKYFPGAGGMTTSDNNSLELGDNFTIVQEGWVQTTFSDNYSDRNLVYKQDAIHAYISDAEEITSKISSPLIVPADNFTATPSNNYPIYSANWSAQTFTANTTYVIGQINLQGFEQGNPTGNATISIRATAGGLPTGADLASGSIAADTWVGAWTYPTMKLTTLQRIESGVMYAIVFRVPNGDAANYVDRGYKTGNHYPGGTRCTSTDSGATWVNQATEDSSFYIYGYPSITATGVGSGNHTIKIMNGIDAASWWNTSWVARKKLTFDNSGCSENLTNVPVAISLDSTSLDWTKVQADGDDVRFIDADDATGLDFFWETWESANKTAIARVEVTQIDALSATDFIYMYWGNDEAANSENMAGVFTPTVELASTHKNSTSDNLTDATSNNNWGAFKAVGQPAWERLPSGLWCLTFPHQVPPTYPYIDLGTDASLANLDYPLSGIAWINPAVFEGDTIFTRVNFTGWWFEQKDDFMRFQAGALANSVDSTGITIVVGAWQQVAFSANGTTVAFYYQGEWDSSPAYSDALGQVGGATTISIDASYSFEGKIALPRIYSKAVSAEEFENYFLQEKHLFGITGGFITFGDTENCGLRIYIDDILKDYTSTATVPNNSNDWTFLQNSSLLYFEEQKISVNGTLRQHIEWEYDNIFTDLSAYSNDATPSFRAASSDADVSAEMISFLPIAEAKAPDYVLGEAPPFIDPGITGNVTGTFTTTPGAGTFPLAVVITAIADATETPSQLPLLIIAVFIILAVSLSVSAIMRRYGSGTIFVKVLLITAAMGVFIALGNFAIDFWMLVIFLIIGCALAFASKQVGWS